MSILETVSQAVGASKKGRPAQEHRLFAPSVEEKVTAARIVVAEIEGAYHRTMMESIQTGVPGDVQSLRDRLRTAKDELDLLEGTLEAAHKEDEANRVKAIAHTQKTAIRNVQKALAARDGAAIEISEAIEKLAKAYVTLIEQSKAARLASPPHIKFPDSAGLWSRDQLAPLLQHEMWRLSAATAGRVETTALPGASAPAGLHHNPAAAKPLAEVLRAASDHIVKTLTGQVG